MNWKLPLFKTYSDEEDVAAVSKIIRRGTYWADGSEIKQFEKKIAEFVGTKYALTFNSGTSALHAGLLAHDIKDGEVIVPSFTFISTVNSVVLVGATPIFAESESETFGLDVADVEKKITDKTKAVINVHYAGCPSRDIEKLKILCHKHDLILIEDAAESLGATINKKNVGTFGDSAMFSFCQGKIISSGEGGAIVTNSKPIYEKMKLVRSHGRVETQETDYFSSIGDNDYVKLGYNFRMPTMCATLGLSQLSKIKKMIEARKAHADFLNREMGKLKDIMCLVPPEGFNHVYQFYTIMLKNPRLRDSLQQFLKEKGIMTKVYFNPVHLKTFYREEYGCKEGDLLRTETLSKNVLTLPMYVSLSREDLTYIVTSVSEFFKIHGGE